MSKKKLILSQPLLNFTLERLCQEIIENHGDLQNLILIGLQPRGVFVLERIAAMLTKNEGLEVKTGYLDATFYRDDFRRRDAPISPNKTKLTHPIENKDVLIVDDVLATGRMARSAMDALNTFGRPSKIELLCLIDRSYNRDVPIQPDYIGKKVNTLDTQKVLVEWTEQGNKQDKIWLIH